MTGDVQERQAFWRHPRFRDLGLLKARFTGHRYARHTHATYVVALITAGCERVQVGRETVLAPAGSMLVVNPEEWHDGEAGADDGWSYRTFYPQTGFMAGIAAELGGDGPPAFPQAVLDDPALAAAIAQAHRLSETADIVAAEQAMLAALRQLILRHADRRGRPEMVERSGARRRVALYREIIEAGLGADLDLRHLADAAGVTRFQVIRDFRRVAGLTPAAFIRDRRLRHAIRLIEGGAGLAEAALGAGFADQSHLSRLFRATQGFTPGMLKRAGASRERLAG